MLSQDDQSKDHQPSGTCQELITVLAAHWQIHCVTINKITPHILIRDDLQKKKE